MSMGNYHPKSVPEYMAILRRRKKAFIVPVLLVAALGAAVYPLIPKQYRSASVLLFSDSDIAEAIKGVQRTPNLEKKLQALSYQMGSRDVRERIVDLMQLKERIANPEERRKRIGSLTRRFQWAILPGNLVNVSFMDPDPELAQLGANAFGHTLVSLDQENRAAAAQERRAFIEEQLLLYKEKLEDSERPFLLTTVKTNLDNAIQQRSLILDQLYQLEKTVNPRQRIENPVIFKLQTELTEARSVLKKMRINAREDSPLVRDIKRKVYELEQAISIEKENMTTADRSQVNPKYMEVLRNLKQVNMRIASLRKRLDRLRAGEGGSETLSEEELASLDRQKKVTEDIFNSLLRGLENAQLSMRLDAYNANGSLRVIEPAGLPANPSWPDPMKMLAIVAFLAFVAGGANVVLKEMNDTSFRNVQDVREHLRLPILAAIPPFNIVYRTRALSLPYRQGGPSDLVVAYHNPQSLATEFYRLLGTQLRAVVAQTEFKSMLMTSALSGDGKSVTVVNLGVLLANEAKKRVLIVDADFRQGVVAKHLGVSDRNGLSDYVAGRVTRQNAVKSTVVDNLSIIPTGTAVANPAKILDSDRMRQLVEAVRAEYDLVMFDGPPLVPLADVPLLTHYSDGIVLTVKIGETPRGLVEEGLSYLGKEGQKRLLGCVLTNAPNTVPSYTNRYFVGGGLALTR